MALVTCPECKKQVSTAAPTCPNCGHPISSKQFSSDARSQPKKKTSPLVWVLAVIIGMAFIGTWQRDLKQGTSIAPRTTSAAVVSSQPTPTRMPVIQISPGALLQGYRDNEVREDDQLSGHEIEVSGNVERISKGLFDEIVVELQTGERLSVLRAYMVESDHAAAAALSKDQKVIVRCARFRFSVGSPVGSDCHLI